VIGLPRKLHIAIVVLFVSATLVLAYVLLTNNVPEYDSSQNVINIIFKYGTGARNELNTFEGTYTKDLVLDNTITTRMILSQEELRQIQQRITEMDLFSFPDNFSINPSGGVTPQTDYLGVCTI
jgi:predicted PurR-regulated permease PerM